MGGQNYFDQFDKPGSVPLTQGDPRRAPEVRRATNEAIASDLDPATKRATLAHTQAETLHTQLTNKQLQDAQNEEAALRSLAPNSDVHGEGYFGKYKVDAGTAAIVRAVSDGRMQVPSFALKTPYWQGILHHVANYDPSFDLTNFNARNKARADFGPNGQNGRAIIAMSTAMKHGSELQDDINGMDNKSGILGRPYNAIGNAYDWWTGDQRINSFLDLRHRYSEEGAKILQPSGAGTGPERTEGDRLLGLNDPKQAQMGVLKTDAQAFLDNIRSRVFALRQSLGPNAKIQDFFDPETIRAYQKLVGPDGAWHDAAQKSGDPLADTLSPGATSGGGAPPGAGGPPRIGGAPPGAPSGGVPPWSDMPNGGPQQSVATGSTKSSFDPVVAGQVEAMIRSGRAPDEINAFLASRHASPIPTPGILSIQSYLKTHPHYANFVDAEQTAPTTWDERLSASPTAAYTAGAANALTAGYMDEIGGGVSALLGGDYTTTRDRLNANKHALADTHPIWNFAGNVSGGLLGLKGAGAIASKVAPGAVALGANVLGRAAPAVGDAAYGGLYGSGEDNQDRLGGAIKGGGASLAGGMLGRGVVSGLAGAASPVVAPAVQNLADHGIIMSAAQRAAASGSFLGRTRLGLENAMTHLPGLGDAIQAQRGRQIAQFGNGMINDAISPINATVQPGLSGNAAVDAAHNAVSDAYDKALPGITGNLDQPFHDTHAQILDRVNALPQDQRDLFNTIYSRKVAPFMPTPGQPMTGQALQDIKRGIDKPMMKLGRSGNPADEYLADELGNMRQNYFDWAQRAAPAKAADFQNANQSFANMVRIDRAAGAAKRDGLFTPDQALTAIRTNSSPQQFASGNAPMQGYAQDAAQILPSTLPDSGTGKRTLVNGIAALLGTGASALNPAALVPIGVGAAKSMRYLPRIDAGLQSLAIGERPQAMIDAGTWLRNQKKPVGMMGSLGTLSYFNH